jgi:hypothetical protein
MPIKISAQRVLRIGYDENLMRDFIKILQMLAVSLLLGAAWGIGLFVWYRRQGKPNGSSL